VLARQVKATAEATALQMTPVALAVAALEALEGMWLLVPLAGLELRLQ
jgi:hypothetical protein